MSMGIGLGEIAEGRIWRWEMINEGDRGEGVGMIQRHWQRQ